MPLKKHRPSLKDLASRLGVSIATVSRALRNSHEVGEDMKRQVQELAKELNYRPNPFARSLRKESPRIIGVVVPNLVTHYYASVLDGVEEYAIREGYSVICANSHESYMQEEQLVDNFVTMHVEGIIACLAQDTVDYSHFIEINNMGIPLVFFARTCLPEMFSSVVSDGDVAAHKATQHLIDNGCRKVAFLGGPNHLDMVRRRKHGYLKALRENSIEIDRSFVMCGMINYEQVRHNVIELLQSDNRPDGILAFNNTVTYAAFDAIKTAGLRIPEDVALIGFTGADSVEHTTPKISAVVDRAREQGQKACKLLLGNIQGDRQIRREVVPMEIKIRESSVRK